MKILEGKKSIKMGYWRGVETAKYNYLSSFCKYSSFQIHRISSQTAPSGLLLGSVLVRPSLHHWPFRLQILLFYCEDGGSWSLWNINRYLLHYTASHCRRLWPSQSLPWELQISHLKICCRSLSSALILVSVDLPGNCPSGKDIFIILYCSILLHSSIYYKSYYYSLKCNYSST
jgi:hypothetical protein